MGKVCVSIWLIIKCEMPPLTVQRPEPVACHGVAQEHSVVVLLFGYMPGTKFGKSQHESVKVAVDIEFRDLTAEMLSKLKQAVKNEDFISLYPDCPEIKNCDLYEDPDLPYVTIRGTLIDEMLFDELKALETTELKGVSSLQVRME